MQFFSHNVDIISQFRLFSCKMQISNSKTNCSVKVRYENKIKKRATFWVNLNIVEKKVKLWCTHNCKTKFWDKKSFFSFLHISKLWFFLPHNSGGEKSELWLVAITYVFISWQKQAPVCSFQRFNVHVIFWLHLWINTKIAAYAK